MSEVEMIIEDVIVKLREYGYDAEPVYCMNQKGECISITIKIVGRLA